MNSTNNESVLFLVSGPSGAGKTTLLRYAITHVDCLKSTVSCTTRLPRDTETHGKEYFFMHNHAFDECIAKQSFVEYASISGYRYGTLKSELLNRLQGGESVMIDIDYQGAFALQKLCRDLHIRCILIFITVKSARTLRKRLELRGLDSNVSIDTRLATAAMEVKHAKSYDYCIVNINMKKSQRELMDIVHKYL